MLLLCKLEGGCQIKNKNTANGGKQKKKIEKNRRKKIEQRNWEMRNNWCTQNAIAPHSHSHLNNECERVGATWAEEAQEGRGARRGGAACI